jgi:osmotically-inducible protein OsmY
MKNVSVRIWLPVAVLLALGGCAGNEQRESTGEFIDDSLITTKVKSAFVEDQKVSALHIKVETHKGVVQLSGFASDAQESWKAADLARNVRGVKAIRNDIIVK